MPHVTLKLHDPNDSHDHIHWMPFANGETRKTNSNRFNRIKKTNNRRFVVPLALWNWRSFRYKWTTYNVCVTTWWKMRHCTFSRL
jgi:hypothetical protein